MNEVSSGDTAWLFVSTALVLADDAGLALFYGGMVRAKNVLSTFMHSFFAMGLVTIAWVTVGYSLAFGPTHGGIVGGAAARRSSPASASSRARARRSRTCSSWPIS